MKLHLALVVVNLLVVVNALRRVFMWILHGADSAFPWMTLVNIFINGLCALWMWVGYKSIKYRARLIKDYSTHSSVDTPLTEDIEVARYGLRTFRVNTKATWEPRGLRSLAKHTYWDNGVMEAKCLGRDPLAFLWREVDDPHVVPVKDCSCGVYATVSLDSLMHQYPAQALKEGVAVIAAEGPTIIGDMGMRTSAARIVAYWCPNKKKRKVYEETCGPEVRHFRKMSDMLEAYGLPPCPSFPMGFLETRIALAAVR